MIALMRFITLRKVDQIFKKSSMPEGITIYFQQKSYDRCLTGCHMQCVVCSILVGNWKSKHTHSIQNFPEGISLWDQ